MHDLRAAFSSLSHPSIAISSSVLYHASVAQDYSLSQQICILVFVVSLNIDNTALERSLPASEPDTSSKKDSAFTPGSFDLFLCSSVCRHFADLYVDVLQD